jgi:CoA:oxalate CoA-transferase
LRDERFLDREKRKINRDLLNYILTEVLKENTTNYWVKLFEKYDIPCGEILNLKEVFNLEHTKQRNMIIKLKADYIKEDVKIINIAPKFSNIENFGATPPPKLGEHSELVLSTL